MHYERGPYGKLTVDFRVLEAMALQNLDILVAMQKDLGGKLRSVKVDGGATANDLLMQLQADYLGQSVYRPVMIESTVAGAAFLAGLGVGLWKDLAELKKVWRLDKEFSANLKSDARKARVTSWHKAVSRALKG